MDRTTMNEADARAIAIRYMMHEYGGPGYIEQSCWWSRDALRELEDSANACHPELANMESRGMMPNAHWEFRIVTPRNECRDEPVRPISVTVFEDGQVSEFPATKDAI